MEPKLFIMLMSTVLLSVSGHWWKDGDNGQVSWTNDCDFYGNDFQRLSNTRGELCGSHCIRETRCTHFSWVDIDGGTCFLKANRRESKDIEAVITDGGPTRLCGYVKSRINTHSSCPCPNQGAISLGKDCEFTGHDIDMQLSPAEQCGSTCLANIQCTHFTWIGGTCYLKRMERPSRKRSYKLTLNAVCGLILPRLF